VVCVCGTGRTTPTLVGGRTAAGRCKTGPRPLPQAALNETSSISVIFIYLYCEIHIFNYSSICLRTTPFELLQNHLTRVQRVKRDPTPQKWDLDAERTPRDHPETTRPPRDHEIHKSAGTTRKQQKRHQHVSLSVRDPRDNRKDTRARGDAPSTARQVRGVRSRHEPGRAERRR
jgi:hypothetical protein